LVGSFRVVAKAATIDAGCVIYRSLWRVQVLAAGLAGGRVEAIGLGGNTCVAEPDYKQTTVMPGVSAVASFNVADH
jgi:hypothetical protein